jgi:molybdate transport system ATP-binding protein
VTEGLSITLRQFRPIPLEATLRVEPGELVALVGPSGAGKTSVLRAIAGLLVPNAGRIVCAGETWFDADAKIALAPQRRRVGLVFQNYALFPHLSALENIAIAMGDRPVAARADRARLLLDLVHLGGLEGRRPRELSGGQQQRVALARALARDPKVLLLDEPFAAVDQVTRRKLQRELSALRRKLAVPILLVTHDLEEAAILADRMIIIHRGQTLQDGPPREVLRRPASALVARLTDQRNLFDGTIAASPAPGRSVLRWGALALEIPARDEFPPGTGVAWTIAPSDAILHSRHRPSLGERENPVAGAVVDLLRLGETALVAVAPDGAPGAILWIALSEHVIERNAVAIGEHVKLSLVGAAIHVMPPDERAASA